MGALKGQGSCWSCGAGTLWRQRDAAPVPQGGEQAFLRAGILVSRAGTAVQDCPRNRSCSLFLGPFWCAVLTQRGKGTVDIGS